LGKKINKFKVTKNVFSNFSVCISMALSIPSEYFELKAPQEVQNCISENGEAVGVCSASYIATLFNGTILQYNELMK
jgi:hypothetical protein